MPTLFSRGFSWIFALMAMSLTAQGQAQTQAQDLHIKKSITVGFSQIGAESAWRTAETASVRYEAAKRGVNLKFSDAQQKQENQIKALGAFIVQRVDAIILAPKVEEGWEPILKQAKAAKIPVILVDRGVNVSDDSLYSTLIASDFVAEGRMAGQWLAKKLDGKGSVVELQGTTGAAPDPESSSRRRRQIARGEPNGSRRGRRTCVAHTRP